MQTIRRIVFLAMLLVATQYAQAQDSPAFDFTFNHLALSVKDVNASADFYAKVLGLKEITNKAKLDGVRWFAMGEGKELHLISIIKEPVVTNKAVHLALTTANFDAFIKTLQGLKLAYSDWAGIAYKVNIRADGIKQVFFQDPDEYWIEVNSVAQK